MSLRRQHITRAVAASLTACSLANAQPAAPETRSDAPPQPAQAPPDTPSDVETPPPQTSVRDTEAPASDAQPDSTPPASSESNEPAGSAAPTSVDPAARTEDGVAPTWPPPTTDRQFAPPPDDPPPEAPPPASPPPTAPATVVPPQDDYPIFRPGVRIMGGFEYFDEPDPLVPDTNVTGYGFFMKQIRLKLGAQLNELLRAAVSADLSDALSPEFSPSDQDRPPYLKNAFLNLRFSRRLQLKLGRFKRPFSALEQRNAGRLEIRGRGLLNNLVLEEKEWGDRAVGAMLWGRFRRAGLRYQLAVQQALWRANLRTQGLDVLARVRYELTEWLELGVNGGAKVIEIQPDTHESFYAGGADINLDPGNLFVLLEGTYAQLPFPDAGRASMAAFGLLGLVSYDIPLSDVYTLQPAGFFEYADADDEFTQNESIRGVVGLNSIFYGAFRVMPQVEIVRPAGTTSRANPWGELTRAYLMLSLEI